MAAIRLAGKDWVACPAEARAAFLPASLGAWSTFPKLEDLFGWNGSGVMPGRTWVIAPDAQSLKDCWEKLVGAPVASKEALFHPHVRNGELGDKHTGKVVMRSLAGFEFREMSVANDTGAVVSPVLYGYRSFDRQWIIPDARLINQPNPELWEMRSEEQVFLTAFLQESPSSGPAVTFTGLVPDLHHYKGSFGGRVFPLWRDGESTQPNVKAGLLAFLSKRYGRTVDAGGVMAYLAGIAAHPAYTARFQDDLSTPGLRMPITADAELFDQVVAVGRRVIWLHTFGDRMADEAKGRPFGPPRLPEEVRPRMPAREKPKGEQSKAVTTEPLYETMRYETGLREIHLDQDRIVNVTPAMWAYEVSGKQVLTQWFSYRRRNRERPVIGDRRKPSELSAIQPDHWLPEYTTELLNVLNVLGLLVELEPEQAELLEEVCAGARVTEGDLREAGALAAAAKVVRRKKGVGNTLDFD